MFLKKGIELEEAELDRWPDMEILIYASNNCASCERRGLAIGFLRLFYSIVLIFEPQVLCSGRVPQRLCLYD